MDWAATGLRHRWWAELLDVNGQILRQIPATGFSIDAKAGADVQLSGSLDLVLTGEPLAWSSHQCRISVEADAGREKIRRPLLTGLMEAGDETRTPHGVEMSLQLLDPTVRLDAAIGEARSAGPGTLITGRIRQVLAELGILDPAITESSRTLSTGMVWTPTVTWRRMLNDLTGAANYRATWADEWGRLQVHPYLLPSSRPVAAQLVHGPSATFLPEVGQQTNAAKIPNHLVVTSQSDGETEPMVAVRSDTDPASQWSIPARGGRVISRVEENIEAADQATLEAHADRLWASSRSLSRKLALKMRWQPIRLGDRLRVVAAPSDAGGRLDVDVTVQGIALSGSAGQPLDLAQLELEVIDGG